MSLWNFFGGAADAILDKRKRDMAAKLQKDLEEQRMNFQMTLEQQRAEREQDRYLRDNESENLNRRRQDERYEAERADRAAEREERKAEKAEDRAYRERRDAASDSRHAESIALQREGLAIRSRANGNDKVAADEMKALNADLKAVETDILKTFGGADRSGVPQPLPAEVSSLLQEARSSIAKGDKEAAMAALDMIRSFRYSGGKSPISSPNTAVTPLK